MPLRFGTDGLRGVANADLGPDLVMALGRAVARVIGSGPFLIGRDTRRSGPLLQSAMAAGLAAEGLDVVDLGVLPTPAVAWLSEDRGLPAAMISASHNPFPDNGIKLFSAGGAKVADSAQLAIEAEMDRVLAGPLRDTDGPTASGVGEIVTEPDAVAGYLDHIEGATDGRLLEGVRVILDCACGASSKVGPAALRRLGADVTVIADDPDGTNINEGCGSTHPERLRAAVLDDGSAVGLAFDGDADRMLAVDESGQLVDGDQLLCMFARDLKARGSLAGGAVVVTVMSNFGLRLALEKDAIEVHVTGVGDRQVMEELEARGLVLGGESSGHIIFRHLATTGDGILTGVLLLDLLARKRSSLAELAQKAMTRLPQELVNVAVADRDGLEGSDAVWAAVEQLQQELGGQGRVLLRASGTESLVRVMVEAPTPEVARTGAARLAGVVAATLGGEAVGGEAQGGKSRGGNAGPGQGGPAAG